MSGEVVGLVGRALASDARLRTPLGAETHAGRVEAWPRHILAYVAHAGAGLSRRTTAALISRSRPLVTYAVQRVEDARDDPQFDEAIEQLCGEAARLCA